MNIEEQIYIRSIARENKEWKICDFIRDELDKHFVFIFDTKDGQEIYYELQGTRKELIDKINSDIKAEKQFDAWLYSINQSIKNKKKKNKI